MYHNLKQAWDCYIKLIIISALRIAMIQRSRQYWLEKGVSGNRSPVWRILQTAVFFALLFIANAARSQDNSPYLWRYWNVSDGLRESYCGSLTIDHEGKIWVNHGSSDTISVLDGFGVTQIYNSNLPSGNIYHTEPDAFWSFAGDRNVVDSRHLFIGLQRFINNQCERFVIPDMQENRIFYNEPFKFLELEQSRRFHLNVWKFCPIDVQYALVLLPTSVSLFNAETQELTPVLTSEESSLGEWCEIIRTESASAWAGAEHGAARLVWERDAAGVHVQSDVFPFPDELNLVSARHLVNQGETELYATALSTQSGEMVPVVWDGTHWKEIELPGNHASVSDVWRVKDRDEFMLTMDSTRQRFSELVVNNQGKSHSYPLPYQLRSNEHFKPQIDADGNAWLNLFVSGVARGALKLWRRNYQIGANDESSHTMEPLLDHGIAVLFLNRLVIYDGVEAEEHPLPGDGASLMSVIAINRDELLFMDSNKRLSVYSLSQKKYRPAPIPEGVRVIGLDYYKPNQALVILQHKETPSHYEIVLYDDGSVYPFLDLANTDDVGDVLRIQFAQSGDMWICGFRGLRQYSAAKELNRHVTDSYPGRDANFMLEPEKGKIWIGGSDGIFQFDGTHWLPVRNDFIVRVMRKAQDGSVWVISEEGVYRFFMNSWVTYAEQEGLADILNCFNIMEDRDGTIWLATNKGIFQYDPNADHDPPRTMLDGSRNFKDVTPDGNTLIQFDGVDKWKYTPKNRLMYSYHVDDGEWTPFQEKNSAYLQNLVYGQHTFQVRAMDRSGNIDPTPEQFEIFVHYPWYLQTGFIISFIGFTAILVFRFINLEYLVRLRTAGLKEEMNKRQQLEGMVREVSEREQRRIGQDLHDGLSQLLAGTRMLVIRLFDTLESKNAPEAESVNYIQSLLEQSMGFTRDMIRGLTPISLGRQELDDALSEFALNIQKMFDVSCIVERNAPLVISSSMVKTNVYRIVQEAVNNAIKHGNASLITIKVNNDKDGYTVAVHDNGSGFNPSATASKGMGLHIMEYRAGLFHGTVSVQNNRPNGVVVICKIPHSALRME